MSFDKKIKAALDELRMLMMGAQILLGFQFQAPFQASFDRLPAFLQLINVVAVALMIAVVGLLIAPNAYHRIVEDVEVTISLRRMSRRSAAATLMPLAAVVGIDGLLIAWLIMTPAPAIFPAAAAFVLALCVWYALGFVPTGTVKEEADMSKRKQEGTSLSAKVEYVLTEARVVLPGAQALLGFQLVIVLTEPFSQLPEMLRQRDRIDAWQCLSRTQHFCREVAKPTGEEQEFHQPRCRSRSNPMSLSSQRRHASSKQRNHRSRGSQTAETHRSIQSKIDRSDERKRKNGGGKPKPMQAGARLYPVPPFPKQHQPKPGQEARLGPAPMYDAPHYKGSEKLKDKVAIITGADSGIGRAVAVLFAREGADIVIVYLDEHKDAEETRRAVEVEGRSSIIVSGDVSDRTFCESVVEKTIAEFGRLDVLVNNAAFQEHINAFEELTPEHFDKTLKTNLYGYFHMAQAAVPYMRPGGSIVMTSSVTGLLGSAHLLDYSLTKGGINAFTRSLGSLLVERGIRVNAVAPGPVWTPLNPADKDAERMSQFGSQTPMKRPAQPEEIAPAYVFLAAPSCSSYITGEILPIIGGYSGG